MKNKLQIFLSDVKSAVNNESREIQCKNLKATYCRSIKFKFSCSGTSEGPTWQGLFISMLKKVSLRRLKTTSY